ncbi:hypothetical protein F4814DRAFT_413987 [Daldinia grandis]|nr:hypothetical protein F4814DRAFT_413987 [Daldinia grandis]
MMFEFEGASQGGIDLISCSNVTKDDTWYCCNGVENCYDSGDGRFSVGSHNPTTSATWNAASTKFIVLETTSSTSSTIAISTKDSTASISKSILPNTTSGDSTLGIPANTDIASQPDNTSVVGTAASSSSDLSDGAKAGIGIGAVIGVLFIVGLIYALWRLQKMKKMFAKEHAGNRYYKTPMYRVNVAPPVPPKSKGQISELYGHYSPLHELPAEST